MSQALRSRAEQIWAQGFPGTNSKRHTQYPKNFPQFISKQDKCYVWDENGKKYLDFVSGLGSSVLGYNHPKVTEAVKAQIDTGYVSGSLPSPLEVEVAELIREIVPYAEKIRFMKTGSECCSAAVRIARAYRHDMRNIYTEGYHGHHDLFTSLTSPALGVKDKFNIKPYTTDKLEWPAAVILEPVTLSLERSRKVALDIVEMGAKNRDAVVIYDEIITGLRVPKYTVSKMWDLHPDIICLGKGIANGYPLAVVAGKKEIMDCGEYFISSTFSGEAVSLAACKATINEVKHKNIEQLMFYGGRLRKRLNTLIKEVVIEGYGTRGMLDVTNEKTAIFVQECAKAGILFGKAWFFNFAHLEENVEEYVMNICYDVASSIRRNKVKLEGPVPKETFVR